MSFKAAKCPNCAGDIQVPDDRDTAKCMYCGSDIIVREAINLSAVGINLENIFRLADEAVNSGNHAEAYNYYTKILESDPENYRAWYGKAISAGWQSTLANLRLPETITGIENAMKYVPEDEKDELKVKAAASLNQLSIAIYNIAHDNFTTHITLETHREFIARLQLIITVLEIASLYKPDDQEILKNIIVVHQTCLQKYTNKITFDTVVLTASFYNDVAIKIQEVKKKLQLLDPSYTIEVPSYRKTCFIATAAYGSAMESEVVMLRRFRDHCLKNTLMGEIFINVYYHFSPPLAALISKSDALKAMTRFLLKPIIYLLKRFRINPTQTI